MDEERIISWRELEQQEIARKIADCQVRLRDARRHVTLFNDALQSGDDARHLLRALDLSRNVDWHGLLDVLGQLSALHKMTQKTAPDLKPATEASSKPG